MCHKAIECVTNTLCDLVHYEEMDHFWLSALLPLRFEVLIGTFLLTLRSCLCVLANNMQGLQKVKQLLQMTSRASETSALLQKGGDLIR